MYLKNWQSWCKFQDINLYLEFGRLVDTVKQQELTEPCYLTFQDDLNMTLQDHYQTKEAPVAERQQDEVMPEKNIDVSAIQPACNDYSNFVMDQTPSKAAFIPAEQK